MGVSCRRRHRCVKLIGHLHHVNIVAFAAEPLHIGSPTEFSEIKGCDEALEVPFVVYVNMVEPFGSGLYWLVVWIN